MPEAEIQNNAATAFDVPRHVAIIMDGNGRWAAARGLPRRCPSARGNPRAAAQRPLPSMIIAT